MKLSEAIKILSGHVLRVLDAPAAIAVAMRLFDLRVHIQDCGNAGVTDGVRANL